MATVTPTGSRFFARISECRCAMQRLGPVSTGKREEAVDATFATQASHVQLAACGRP